MYLVNLDTLYPPRDAIRLQGSLHVEAVLDGSTGDLLSMLSYQCNVGKGWCSLIEAEVFMSEDADQVVVRDTASAELGDRDKGAVA